MAKKTKKQEKTLEEQEVILTEESSTEGIEGTSPQEMVEENTPKSFKDEFGVEYSVDGKILMSVPKDLTEYVIREGTEEIADWAFDQCVLLTKITVPASVKTLRLGCFRYCKMLEEFFAPGIQEEFPSCVFLGCTNLKNVYIPYGIRVIGNSAFENCKSMQSVFLPADAGELYIDSHAFCGSGLRRAYLPYMDFDDYGYHSGLFECCFDLEYAEIDGDVLPERLFSGCTKLREVNIIGNLERIDAGAFYYCLSLSVIKFKNKVLNKNLNFEEIWKWKNDEQEIEIQIPYSERDSFQRLIEQAATVPGITVSFCDIPKG